jgi:hypothetical protein
MQELTTELLGKACGVFLALAYPEGAAAIPEPRRAFLALPPGQAVADWVQNAGLSRAVCQPVRVADGSLRGYALRLGSADFPHLKLMAQWVGEGDDGIWVFAVDTHDAFFQDQRRPPPGHPDAAEWTRLQVANRQLKESIERAWEHEGLCTFNSLLRSGLGPG